MNRASSATGWVRNPVMKLPNLDHTQASSYDLGLTLNPFSGCLNRTTEGLCLGGMFPCYAYKLANGRLRTRYLANKNYYWASALTQYDPYNDPFYPRFWPERIFDSYGRFINLGTKPKGIFVCDMGELFGDWVPGGWQDHIFKFIKMNPIHRFYLLTKQSQNLPLWSPFPDNCWVGVTATSHQMFVEACLSLGDIKASVKYISIEPLLSWGDYPADKTAIEQWAKGLSLYGINWVIIGACTGRSPELLKLKKRYPSLTLMTDGHQWALQPKIEWVEEIVQACDKAGVPVFLKDNLKPLISYPQQEWAYGKYKNGVYTGLLKQEMPCGEG